PALGKLETCPHNLVRGGSALVGLAGALGDDLQQQRVRPQRLGQAELDPPGLVRPLGPPPGPVPAAPDPPGAGGPPPGHPRPAPCPTARAAPWATVGSASSRKAASTTP